MLQLPFLVVLEHSPASEPSDTIGVQYHTVEYHAVEYHTVECDAVEHHTLLLFGAECL